MIQYLTVIMEHAGSGLGKNGRKIYNYMWEEVWLLVVRRPDFNMLHGYHFIFSDVEVKLFKQANLHPEKMFEIGFLVSPAS